MLQQAVDEVWAGARLRAICPSFARVPKYLAQCQWRQGSLPSVPSQAKQG